MERFLGLPELASAHGAELDRLTGWVHWLMLILFVGWGAFFLFVLFRFRARRQPRANYQGVKSHVSSYLEGGVALFEAVLLVGFALPLWAKRVNEMPSPGEALELRVIGEQFAWNVHYPGPDGVFGRTDIARIDPANPVGLDRDDLAAKDDVVAINQLRIPVDQPILVHLSTKDVIHSFSLPVMRVKQDAIPGMSIPVSFTPIKTGKWEIACAQLCGLGHFRMRGFLTVMGQGEFDEWMAAQQEKLRS